jgi:histidine triad (HIT) family protein
MFDPACVFCQIASGSAAAALVYEDTHLFAFLDNRPLFPGHILLCPRDHYPTLLDLPAAMNSPLLEKIKLLSKALEAAVQADGSFIAVNNKISQSVPHLHVHIVPRKKKDGLRGFFWPRRKYASEAGQEAMASAIKREIETLTG